MPRIYYLHLYRVDMTGQYVQDAKHTDHLELIIVAYVGGAFDEWTITAHGKTAASLAIVTDMYKREDRKRMRAKTVYLYCSYT